MTREEVLGMGEIVLVIAIIVAAGMVWGLVVIWLLDNDSRR